MANTITSTQSAPSLLVPGMAAAFGQYDHFPLEYRDYFTLKKSEKAYETYVELETMVGAAIYGEGAMPPQGSQQETSKKTVYNQNIGIRYTITANMLEDNLYEEQFPLIANNMQFAMQTAKEYLGASPFDNAFSTVSPFALGDGSALCSTNHQAANNTQSNTLGKPTQLSQSAYQDSIKGIQYFKDYSGKPIKVLPTKLFVGIENEWTAAILTNSQYSPESGNNAINPLLTDNYVRGHYLLSHYLSNPFNWFIFTDYYGGLVYQLKRGINSDVTTDTATGNYICMASERYAFTGVDYRSIFGVQSLI